MNAAPDEQEFAAFLEFLKEKRALDFTSYKRGSLGRRVARRMQVVGAESLSAYMDFLEVHPDEFTDLLNTVLINVTSFFRDSAAWDHLASEVIPAIVKSKGPEDMVRVWSAGCASGEEAYSVAMLLAEALGPAEFVRRVKIYATDADEEALTQARHGAYTTKDLQPVSEELRDRYFQRSGSVWTFRSDLRRSVIFGRHNLLEDAPISSLDLLVCRNTLMYFNLDAQRRALARFHFALDDTGYLFLGKAEMLLTHTGLFEPVSLRHRTFRKIPPLTVRDRLLVLAQAGEEDAAGLMTRNTQLRNSTLDGGAVPELVVDAGGLLSSANEAARSLFGISRDDIGRPFRDLGISYRPVELRSLLEQADKARRTVRLGDVEHQTPGSGPRYYEVTVRPYFDGSGQPLGTSITFSDITRYRALEIELARSKEDLETAYEELQSANEELETTNEELQSSNEELETTNEELQSSNEELETMNEELQSANEELQTANDELRERTDETNDANAFLESILASSAVGVVVVDRELDVRMWNHQAEDMWGLHRDEVIGKSLLNLDIGLPVAQLREPIHRVLAGGNDCDVLALQARNRRGHDFKCRVRCGPLTSSSGTIDGVILLMEDRDEEGHPEDSA